MNRTVYSGKLRRMPSWDFRRSFIFAAARGTVEQSSKYVTTLSARRTRTTKEGELFLFERRPSANRVVPMMWHALH